MHTQPLNLRILGTGEYLPKKIVASTEFDARWNKPDGWTAQHSGVTSRRYADAAESSSYMGAQAALMALEHAQLKASDLDCVISACSVMEQAIPCSAALIHRELGLNTSGIPAFDINATCLSFLVALDLAAAAIAVGRYRRVLIVSSEIASHGLDWNNTQTAPLFGDGAAAAVVGHDSDAASLMLGSHFATYSEGADLCQLQAGGTKLRPQNGIDEWIAGTVFEMNGRATYRMASQYLPQFMEVLLTKAQARIDALQVIVPHQASGQALSHLERALEIPPEQLIRILSSHGNQIAASLPCALHEAITSQRIKRGDHFALVGSGAGLSFGGIVLRY